MFVGTSHAHETECYINLQRVDQPVHLFAASCQVQCELEHQLLFNSPTAFQEKVRRAYAAVLRQSKMSSNGTHCVIVPAR